MNINYVVNKIDYVLMLMLIIFQISTSLLPLYAVVCRSSSRFRSISHSNRFREYVDDGTVTRNNLDRNLVHRQRAKYRKLYKKVTAIQSLYFYGKQNKTLQNNGKLVVEEHVALLCQPGNVCIALDVTSSKSSKDTSDAIFKDNCRCKH